MLCPNVEATVPAVSSKSIDGSELKISGEYIVQDTISIACFTGIQNSNENPIKFTVISDGKLKTLNN